MSVTHQSDAKRLSTGKTAKRLLGAAAVALAATTAVQRVNAATYTSAYQGIYVSNSIDGNSQLINPTYIAATSHTVAYIGGDPNNIGAPLGGAVTAGQIAALDAASTVGLTVTLSPGEYLAFDIGGAVTGNANPAAGQAYDNVSHKVTTGSGASKKIITILAHAEPSQLGISGVAYRVTASNVNNLNVAPLVAGGIMPTYNYNPLQNGPEFSQYTDPAAGVGYGTNGASVLTVGTNNFIGGVLTALDDVYSVANATGGGSTSRANLAYFQDTDSGSFGSTVKDAENDYNAFNVFSQMAFQAVGNLVQTTTVLSPTVVSTSLSFVTMTTASSSLSNASVEPAYQVRVYNSGSGLGTDVYTDVPALTIVVTAVPEPASLGLIGSAATLLLARRRKARLQ